MANRAGQQFGGYRLLRLLGKGHFAEVYLAQHLRFNIQRAIKILRENTTADFEKFRAEAEAIATLKHPHIVRLYEFDIYHSIPYLVMDYAPNGTLRDRHPIGTRLDLDLIIKYVNQIAQALQQAHAAKLIHRDVKPENILLGEHNQVLLSDFGIVTVAHSTASMETLAGDGTPVYMAPEQIQGKPRPASDQYSLGIMVYEWLCGTPPFDGQGWSVIGQHLHNPLPPLHIRIPGISPRVEQVVFQALAKDHHERFNSVQIFADALKRANQMHFTIALPEALPGLMDNDSRNPNRRRSNAPNTPGEHIRYYSVLDIGTSSVKAFIAKVSKHQHLVDIFGSGVYPQRPTHMSHGVVANIAGVTANCNEALCQAEEASQLIAPSGIMSIAGPQVIGSSITLSKRRYDPAQPILQGELDNLISRAYKDIREKVRMQIAQEVGFQDIPIRHIESVISALCVDQKYYANPIGQKGYTLELTLFAVFAPLAQASALESVAQGLDLSHVTLMSVPLALARYLDQFTDENGGSIIIDLGYGTTDIILIRRGKIAEIRSLAKGGLDFTQCIARGMRVRLGEAERMKRMYSNNDRSFWRYKDEIHELLYEECQRWIENVQRTLQTMTKTDMLPSIINIVGGCSLLPDLYEALEHDTWKKGVPFSSSPTIQRLDPPFAPDITNTTDIFTGPASITPIAIAFQILELEDEKNVVTETFKRITQG